MAQRVLVTGFTGRLGGRVAAILRDVYGARPRVLVRPPRLSATEWSDPPGIEVVAGDYTEPGSLEAALAGVDCVFLVSPVHPEMCARELALAEQAARMTDPPHIVKVSGLGTQLDSFVDSGRWHAEIEQGIRDLGLRATFLRPLFFMQNLGFQLDAIRQTGLLRGGVGDAAIAMVDLGDIAEVAAAALIGETPITGQSVSLTGPRAYTYHDVANALSNALDRPVTYQSQSLDEVRAALEQSNLPAWHIQILLQFNEAFLLGWGSEVSDTVELVLGRPPRTLDEVLETLTGSVADQGSDPFPS